MVLLLLPRILLILLLRVVYDYQEVLLVRRHHNFVLLCLPPPHLRILLPILLLLRVVYDHQGVLLVGRDHDLVTDQELRRVFITTGIFGCSFTTVVNPGNPGPCYRVTSMFTNMLNSDSNHYAQSKISS